MTAIVIDGTAKRAEWRANCAVYRAAMRKALASIPVGNASMLAIADMIAASPEVDELSRIAWHDVTQFERMNSDISRWAPFLIAQVAPGVNDMDAVIDAIFCLALAFESGNEVRIAADRKALLKLLA